MLKIEKLTKEVKHKRRQLDNEFTETTMAQVSKPSYYHFQDINGKCSENDKSSLYWNRIPLLYENELQQSTIMG